MNRYHRAICLERFHHYMHLLLGGFTGWVSKQIISGNEIVLTTKYQFHLHNESENKIVILIYEYYVVRFFSRQKITIRKQIN